MLRSAESLCLVLCLLVLGVENGLDKKGYETYNKRENMCFQKCDEKGYFE